MRRISSMAMLALAAVVLAGRATAQTRAPTESRVAAHDIDLPAILAPTTAVCLRVPASIIGAAAVRSYSLVAPDSVNPVRRINVSLDSANAVVAYSDVLVSADGYTIYVGRTSGGTVFSRRSPGKAGAAPADSMLGDPRLGPPSALAADVIKRCAPPPGPAR